MATPDDVRMENRRTALLAASYVVPTGSFAAANPEHTAEATLEVARMFEQWLTEPDPEAPRAWWEERRGDG